MMLTGKAFKSDSGRRIRVESLIKAGGQGEAYLVTERKSGQKGVLKSFHQRFANRDTVARLRFLMGEDLPGACPVIFAPVDLVLKRNMVAHYTPFAVGDALEEFLVNPELTFIEAMQLAITLAHAVATLHRRGIAHGDLHAENLIVEHVGTVYRLHLIDLDNFSVSGLPNPPCVGHNLYMAPELREALGRGKDAVPSVQTDLFALGVLMHEIILLRHLCAGSDATEEEFQKAMCSGRWIQDPAAADRPTGSLGGYPVEVLNADLARLFRSAVSLDAASRPSAETWEAELGRAFNAIYCCPNCGGPCVVDVSKTMCPLCRNPFPHLRITVSATMESIQVTSGATVLGRSDLGGSPKASSRHAVFRRVGPETWMESYGSNGSYRWNGSGWVRLPDRRPILVKSGDLLRLADVEVTLT